MNATPCDVAGTVLLRAPGNPGRQLEVSLVRGAGVFESGADETWETTLVADGYWMAPSTVAPSSGEDRTIVLEVWKTARLHGQFVRAAEGDELPKAFVTEISSSPRDDRPALPSAVKIDCTVAGDGAWNCAVPAVVADLVVRARSFTPQYLFDVDLTKGAKDIGVVTLRRGASLAAWLDSGTVSSLKRPALARLIPMVTGDASPEGMRLLRPVAEAASNPRGLIQLAPVPPGTYTLEVSAPGFAAERVEPVAVHELSESVLRHPIELGPPVTIRIDVVPARAPHGPWRASLTRRNDVVGRFVRVASNTFDDAGSLVVPGQAPGTFNLEITDADGNRYADRNLIVAGGSEESHHTVELELARINGTVRLGDAPLEATLFFGGTSGDVRVQANADRKGKFDVVLPNAGKWIVDVQSTAENIAATTEVEVETGQALVIDLPDTELSGYVLAADGSRSPLARITAITAGRTVSARAQEDGTFRLRGLRPGRVSLSARDVRSGEESGPVAVTLSAGSSVREVQLAITGAQDLRGVLSSAGVPVVGGRVFAWTKASPSIKSTTTGVDGTFRIPVAERATEVFLVAAAGGRTMQAYRMPVTRDAVQLDLAAVGGLLRLSVGSGATVTYNGAPLLLNEMMRWAYAHNPQQFVPARATGDAPSDVIEIPNLAPGVYRACVSVPSHTEKCREVFLAPRSSAELRLE